MSNTLAMQNKSKNIAGPPVYYPPGVELFAKKEEAMMQSQVTVCRTLFIVAFQVIADDLIKCNYVHQILMDYLLVF